MSIAQNYPAVSPSMSMDFANVKKLDPRVTFARASGATYYDGQTVVLAQENRLKYSEEFNQATAWTTASTATITADATTAPDGTTTADLYTVTSTTSNVLFSQPPLGPIAGTFTGSIYLKASTGAQWVVLRLWKGDGGYTGSSAWFDLVNGVLGSSTAINSASAGASLLGATIQSVGDGWYRVSISGGFSSTALLNYLAVQLVNADASAVTSGQDGNAIFVWGAQLNSGANLIGYSKTTTATVPASYQPKLLTASANVARFDHDPVTSESLGLLVEEQRTNLLTYSEDFSDSDWIKSNVTVTANTVVAPDGTLTMDKLVESTATGGHSIYNASSSVTSGQQYTYSFYAKPAGRTKILTGGVSSSWGSQNCTFDLVNETAVASGSTGTITNVGNNIYRCTWTATAQATTSGTVARQIIVLLNEASASSYTGDGYSGIYIWGAQLEAGAFPTSYIKTEASQVTRSADSASMTGTNFSDWYRQDEGSFYVEYMMVTTSGNKNIFSNHDNTSSNRIDIYASNNNVNPRMYVRTNAVDQANILVTGSVVGAYGKVAGAYKTNDIAVSSNGGAVGTDATATIPLVNSLRIMNDYNGQRPANGYISKLSYYPARLTNTQLQALTGS